MFSGTPKLFLIFFVFFSVVWQVFVQNIFKFALCGQSVDVDEC